VTVNKKVTIDGAQFTYTGKMNLTANTTIKNVNFDGKGSNIYAVETRNAATVVITDCTVKDYGYGFLQVVSSNDKLTVKNVTVSDVNYGIKIDRSNTVTLENVTVTDARYYGLWNSNYGGKTITIKNCNFSSVDTWKRNDTTKTTYVFEGENSVDTFGIVSGLDTLKLAATATLTAPEGQNVVTDVAESVVVYEDGAYRVISAAAKIGGVYYETLAAAYEAAQDGNVIVLLADVTLAEMVKIEKAITLDLNGKTVSTDAQKAFEIYANAEIKNGTIVAGQRCVDTRTAVELTLTDVKLEANSQPLTIGGFDNGTKVTMTNVNINAGGGYGIITFVQTNLTADNTTISGYSALYVKPGSEGSKFTFTGSTLSGNIGTNDVEDNSFATIAVRTDNVTVTADAATTVESVGEYHSAISVYTTYDGDKTAAGANITVAGTIKGEILDADEVLGDNVIAVNAAYADALKNCGFPSKASDEEGLIIAVAPAAKIGKAGYATLTAAIADAKAGDTITLVADITENVTVNKKVTIDGAQFTYTGKMNLTANTTIKNVNFDGKGSNIYAVETR
ncbi:MAG: right-handed parallel beta-helix repeat-containing protein, partial [Oscillospiraceae bacterium]|nr:right-handed parallel beta-helix repeat-containing protein [Oscillospiraceae bacterium]